MKYFNFISYRFLVLFVVSVALWQVTKSFVIKDQESVDNVAHCNLFDFLINFYFFVCLKQLFMLSLIPYQLVMILYPQQL
jgi:hypothetical protein